MMGQARDPRSFFAGFATAAIVLGALLALAWTGFWGADALGGPDLRMPRTILQSGAALVLIGIVLRWLIQARSNPTGGKS